MRQRRLLRFHGLKRPRIRQTWNKYNLYNLMRMRTPYLSPKTFFQQKWLAKSLTRGYHGEHIKEYQWERMFSRRPLSAVNMDPAYMAKYDGSEQAAGRGSGLLTNNSGRGKPRNEGNLNAPTPYMQMVFAPMERRLDIAIFRALFASSARQARQFVLHGAVTVNGKKMTHPGYLLNPGDMFQVDIERVMMATGQPKRPNQNQKALPTTAREEEAAEGEEGGADAEGAAAAAEAAEETAEAADTEAAKKKHIETLKELKAHAKAILHTTDSATRAKRKQALRKYLKEVKVAMDRAGRAGDASASEMADVEQELSDILADLSLSPAELRAKAEDRRRQQEKQQRESQRAGGKQGAAAASSAGTTNTLGLLTPAQRAVVQNSALSELYNPYDPSKPYATPWRPREWMSPFAFIPRYLEVNQRICAAVYLRHPVARPGRSEVPTPFHPSVSQLAFNWYLRRR